MKRLIFDLTATAVVAAIVLFACNKSQVENVEFSAMEEQTLINPANPDNPFDYYGDLHNKSLRIALDELKDSPNASFEERIRVSGQATQKVLSEEGMAMSKATVDTAEFMAALEFLIDDMENNYVNFIAALNLDTYTKNQLQILTQELIAMSKFEDLEYDDVHSKIVEFETNVLNHIITISDNDMEDILACTSTMRHSLSFWTNEKGLFHNDNSVNPEKWRWYHYIIVAAADAFGATVACESGPAFAVGLGVACSGIAAAIIDDNK
ncbi:MAG: hypothetical protein LBV41_02100 [Cytophagaceae bacterium]|jgi:hypothetical protein|nr:hypothetical protein [Cytophagaceae bacterium]